MSTIVASVVTVLVGAAFLGIVIWAYGPSRKDRFEQDGNLPFDDENNIGSGK